METSEEQLAAPRSKQPAAQPPTAEPVLEQPVVLRPSRLVRINDSLKCVWSGYPGEGSGGCRIRVPASVAHKAWMRELEGGEMVEGFFHFSWRESLWLAYGASDGSVRGVYCPAHRSERAARRADAVQRQPAQIALP